MRDPDLIVRAQQAATALESAWCRWRNMHGLTGEPVPAVSSYVGYSLDAPWGEARIVFGICAEEAEQLATLLDRHDCVGPVHASVKAKPVGAVLGSRPAEGQVEQDPADDGNGLVLDGSEPVPDGSGLVLDGRAEDEQAEDQREPVTEALPATQPGFVHVPAPAPASGDQQPLAASASTRSAPPPAEQPDPRPREAAAAALTSQVAPRRSGIGTPIALAASRAVNASIASRRAAASTQSPAVAAEGATEGGAPSDLNGSADVRPAGADWFGGPAGPDGSAGTAGDSAGLGSSSESVASDSEGAGPLGPGSALSDETGIMTGDPESARDLGPLNDRRAVGDRSLAAEPGPDPAADRDAISGPSDSAAPEIVAFRPRIEPTAYYSDSTEPAADNGNGRQAPAYNPDDRERSTRDTDAQQSAVFDADVRRSASHDTDGRRSAGHDADARQAAGYDADARQAAGYDAVGRQAVVYDADARQPAAAESAELASSDGWPGSAAQQVCGEPTRPARTLAGASLSRLRRPGSPTPSHLWGDASRDRQVQGQDLPRDGRDRVSSTAASDAVAWNASELPGQAAITDTAV